MRTSTARPSAGDDKRTLNWRSSMAVTASTWMPPASENEGVATASDGRARLSGTMAPATTAPATRRLLAILPNWVTPENSPNSPGLPARPKAVRYGAVTLGLTTKLAPTGRIGAHRGGAGGQHMRSDLRRCTDVDLWGPSS